MERGNEEITIVPGVEADIDEIETLYNDLNDALESGINYPGWKKGAYPVRADAVKGINEGNLYIAKYKDKIVGSVILNHQPESAYDGVQWKTVNKYSEILVIHTLAVNSNYFRLEIGKRLMNFIYEFAKKINMKSIRLDVYEKNEPAIKLYEKCGYVYIDTVDLGLSNYGLDWFKLYEKVINQFLELIEDKYVDSIAEIMELVDGYGGLSYELDLINRQNKNSIRDG